MHATPAVPTIATLTDGAVHIVRAHLDAPPMHIAQLAEITSAAERERASRFLHEADSHRHIIGRALLRLALARLLDAAPESLPLRSTELGKLHLENGPSFNISHSGNVIMIAIAADGRLGVDVEAVRDLRDLLGLARTSFAYDELAAIACLPPDQRIRPFFRTWTRKEAMLKALGLGLTALDTISVSADAGLTNALLRLDNPDETDHNWVVRSIPGAPEVEAAVAWDRPIRELVVVDV